MPFKTDKLKLNDPFLDKRTKLIPCQKEMVIWWYNCGTSITELSKRFKVNKRLIQFILFPERKQKNLEKRNNRGGSTIYYVKENHTQSVRCHRQYKYKTLKNTIKP